ncbi:MAG: HAD family hydrolase [Planctomycetaceae bacterium]|jgi:phosphoglycolate phosphatase/pyrophosphatase PpaX|nr:HAD family hydrolase [Planctomycetaceae bacterium]
MLKCIIFDFDGTIADSLPLCIEAFRRAASPFLERSITDAEITGAFGPSDAGTIQILVPDHAEECLDGYLKWYRQLHSSMCPQPFDGMRELFGELKNKGVLLGIVTGKGEKSCEISLEFLQLREYFDAVETGSPIRANKPECLKNILHKFNLQPQETVYIGDALSDIRATREVSIPIFSAAWAKTAEPEKLKTLQPDKIIFTVSELKEHLFQLLLQN